MTFLNAIAAALQTVFTLKGALYIFGGAFLGMFLGCIPGLSGGTLITLLLPLMWKIDPVLGLALLISIHIGSTSGGCIGSILLGIPGTSSSMATVWDGYEFTKRGDPVRALSAAVVSNAIGTIPGLLLAAALSSVIATWAVKLGPWEYASMCFASIAMVVALSKGDIVKGLVSVGLAVLLCSIGSDAVYGSQRLTFGSVNLYQGFNVVNILLGMFAANIILMEFARNEKAGAGEKIQVRRFKFPGRDLLDNLGNLIRSFLTGMFVGFLPGLGGPTSTVMAYSNEKALSKEKEKWGHGHIGGVIAPETANNAGIGGALIPMIALGVPGDAIMAQLMVALTCVDIEPGPLFMRQHIDIVYMLFVGGMIAAVFILLIQTLGMPLFPMLLKIPYHFLYPAILILCFIGAYLSAGNLWGVAVTLGACLLGLGMNSCKIPTMPFLMTFILSKLLERNLRLGFNYSINGGLDFLTRPVSLIFILVGVGVLCWNGFGAKLWARRKAKKTADNV